MFVTPGKLPDAILYALGGVPSGSGFDVVPAVRAIVAAFEGGTVPEDARFTEDGEIRLSEDGEIRITEEA